jgi:hypothetical protein
MCIAVNAEIFSVIDWGVFHVSVPDEGALWMIEMDKK